jgi:hypothetical protein
LPSAFLSSDWGKWKFVFKTLQNVSMLLVDHHGGFALVNEGDWLL